MPLTQALDRRLQKYITQSRRRDARSPYIFLALRKHDDDYEPLTRSGVHQLITTLTAQAGINKRVYPHLLRHSYATWALQQGIGPLQLAQILGHSSLAMIFNVYAHLSPQDAHAAAMSVFLVKDDDRR
ncbi:MAG TPA: tyrosine-type recombinase/integrase [Candidatus Dormibacteraeota bacterium]|nr:tyrosine-type recombinase/integrase [Candidatus Dormibacteraeota bacterium]